MRKTHDTIRRNSFPYPFPLFAAALGVTLALGLLIMPAAAQAKNISKTAKAGPYSVTLKVLPAEYFTGPKATMVRDSGALPNKVNGPAKPNHHMVVFIKLNGKRVEHAAVEISYRDLSTKRKPWKLLPLVRMHEAGAGVKSTHFGNNVRLAPGRYEVLVTVNGKGPATFHFRL